MSKEKKYKEIEEELRKCKKLVEDITPLLEKLEGKDEIVRAILNDKITSLDGKISFKIN